MLHRKTAEVTPADDDLQNLIVDMFETMEKAPGVGLAANQIGIDLQVFVYHWEDEEVHRGVAINPKLEILEPVSFSQDLEDDYEGCLSVPGYRYPVARSNKVRLTATNEHGEDYEIIAEGWLARIFQHEFDHLQGLLYVDRLEPHFRSEIDAEIAAEGWGVPGNSWRVGKDYLEP